MPRGYSSFAERQQQYESGEGGTGRGIWGVKLLDDGESCKFRYLTDHEDIYWNWFHRKMENGEFRGMKLCPRSLGNVCEDCTKAKNATSDEEKRRHTASMQVLAWVYEYEHYYTEPKEDRQKVELGRSIRYRKVVNEVRLWRYAQAHMKALEPSINLRGTLTDRDYLWIRSGKKGDNKPQYTLEQIADPAPLPDELKKIALSLPDLEEVAIGRVTSLNGEATEQQFQVVAVVEEETPFKDVVPDSENLMMDSAYQNVNDAPVEEEPF